ncbi:MAG TPA: hypothetical protein VHW25_08455 [Steroidobacteraceae bacterium]|nr:hypothetical protein [Steroidobacteraceae bacterium]
MKRGLIAWDKARLPPAAFTARLDALNQLLDRYDVAVLVIYTDVWRANDVRFVSNFMPYWNRAFAIIARGEKPILLCSLSPRVYPWIKTVTIHETIVPSPSLPAQLLKLATERGWSRIGFLDYEGLPNDLYTQIRAAPLEVVDIAREQVRAAPDMAEIEMHRHAAAIAREALGAAVTETAIGLTEFALIGRIEQLIRRGGAEDLVALVANGRSGFRPATGECVGRNTSVMAAVEYSGHWAKVARNVARVISPLAALEQSQHVETLSACYPWQPVLSDAQPDGQILALQMELRDPAGARLFYGETCLRTAVGMQLL